MILCGILGALAFLGAALTLWQWTAGLAFPLHRTLDRPSYAPSLSVLKPLKGLDAETEACLRTWFDQDYPGEVELLFGVRSPDDPVCALARRLIEARPQRRARLVVCPERIGWNAKVSTLVQLEAEAKGEVVVVSDADVRVRPDFLAQLVQPLASPATGLVHCFYRIGNPSTWAARWEAVGVHADFWSQVLQSRQLRPIDFALGAVMALPRATLLEIGGFRPLANFLADDYWLGRRVAAAGRALELCPLVVECRGGGVRWTEAWAHQVRWARTIRVCQPVPYFFSVLSNGTLWPALWWAACPSAATSWAAGTCVALRLLTGALSQRRFLQQGPDWRAIVLIPVKDALQAALWALAFLGNRVAWRGEMFRVRRDGRLEPLGGRRAPPDQ